MQSVAEAQVKIVNRKGLHARAAAKFAKTSEQFQSAIRVCRLQSPEDPDEGAECVGGTSLLGLMMLAADLGSYVHIHAQGVDAQDAVDALCQLIENRFGEEE